MEQGRYQTNGGAHVHPQQCILWHCHIMVSVQAWLLPHSAYPDQVKLRDPVGRNTQTRRTQSWTLMLLSDVCNLVCAPPGMPFQGRVQAHAAGFTRNKAYNKINSVKEGIQRTRTGSISCQNALCSQTSVKAKEMANMSSRPHAGWYEV